MKIASDKLTMRKLRMRIAARGCLTLDDLADKLDCSRTSIYLAVEKPSRYPNVFKKIKEFIA